ncbi:unnamed protein product [Allacma fusca]|uniref:Uncharacterized protein n=1 Tax=Allacma fusca TaxID=39272 RepID=A0A8J2KKW8_9HEXA|nr:unnamed protein product [Allacma fusca]
MKSTGKSPVIGLLIVGLLAVFTVVLGSPSATTVRPHPCLQLGEHCIGNRLCCSQFCDRTVNLCAPFPERF